jgi:hypothetical protein
LLTTRFSRFLGFTKKTAGEIFANWAVRPGGDKNPEGGILEYALGHLGRLVTPSMQNLHLQPLQAMSILGISKELQNVLVDPQFKQIFESETLYYWLKDTIASRFWTLHKLLDRLKKHAVWTIGKKKEKKRPGIAGVFGSAAEESSSSAQQPSPTTSTATTSLLYTPEDGLLPQAHVAMAATGVILPDHIVLYKGKGVSELTGQEPNPIIVPGCGDIYINSLRTFPGGDFNQTEDAWYWTPEEATAEQYRRWASQRNLYSETWIVRIQVPRTFFTKLRQEELWFSRDWKEYIWYCKKGLKVGYPPAKFNKYWKPPGAADLVKGHITGRHPSVYPRIDTADVQTKINENDVLMNSNQKATQWVIMNRGTADLMAVEIRGKIHIEVYPAVINAANEE